MQIQQAQQIYLPCKILCAGCLQNQLTYNQLPLNHLTIGQLPFNLPQIKYICMKCINQWVHQQQILLISSLTKTIYNALSQAAFNILKMVKKLQQIFSSLRTRLLAFACNILIPDHLCCSLFDDITILNKFGCTLPTTHFSQECHTGNQKL